MMLSGQAGPDQPKPETNKRKSWQAAPEPRDFRP